MESCSSSKAALDSSLHSVVECEASIEKARQDLCELDDFSAYGVFASLRRSNDQASLCLGVFYEWFLAQPQIWSRVSLSSEEFKDLMVPSTDTPIKGMDYDGFLLLVLPRDNELLVGRTIARGSGRPWQYNSPSGRMPPEVAFRFCNLLDAELSFQRSLCSLREGLTECDESASQARDVIHKSNVLRIFLKESRQRAIVRRLTEDRPNVMARGLWSVEALDQLLMQKKIAVVEKPYLVGKVSPSNRFIGARPSNPKHEEQCESRRLKLSACETDSMKMNTKMSDVGRNALKSVPGNGLPQKKGVEGVRSNQQSCRRTSTDNQCKDDFTLLRALLSLAIQQGRLDAIVEATRLTFPRGFLYRLDVVFNALDCFGRGFLSETNLKQFCADTPGNPVEFRHICILFEHTQQMASIVRQSELPYIRDAAQAGGAVGFGASLDSEMQSGFPVDPNMPGRLSFRDFLFLVLTVNSPIKRTLRHADTDANARSLLLILRDSTPCPGCGANIQRDSDASACPYVECPVCGFLFECQVLSSSHLAPSDSHALDSLATFRSFLEVSATNAQECHDLHQQFHDTWCQACKESDTKDNRNSLKRHTDKIRKIGMEDLPLLFERQGLESPSENILLFAWRRLQLFAAQYGQLKS